MSRLSILFVWGLLLVFLAGCQGSLETYTVIHQDYDGSIIQEMSVEAGESVMPPTDPLREGYEFTGWDKPSEVIQEDLVITAAYEIAMEEDSEPEGSEVNQTDLPVLVLTYVEGLEDALGDFLNHPLVVTDSIIDVDYSDYSRMLVLYEDRLRRFYPRAF